MRHKKHCLYNFKFVTSTELWTGYTPLMLDLLWYTLEIQGSMIARPEWQYMEIRIDQIL